MNQKTYFEKPELEEGTIKAYCIGFFLSIFLTMASFLLVTYQLFSKWQLLIAISTLATLQMIGQLIFFLHLGTERKPKWNLQLYLFMALVILILVFGSLWIMYNLSENVMPTHPSMLLNKE